MFPYVQPSLKLSLRHQFHVPINKHTKILSNEAEASYQSLRSLPYSEDFKSVTPLQTSVDYKKGVNFPIVSKKTLPSVATTSFQQYFSPGLEYHYTESVPVHNVNSYQSSVTPETPFFDFYKSYVPSSVPVSHHKNQYESFLSKQFQQFPQDLSSQFYTRMFSRPMYNTVQYSVQLPPYEHNNKRSASKPITMIIPKAL